MPGSIVLTPGFLFRPAEAFPKEPAGGILFDRCHSTGPRIRAFRFGPALSQSEEVLGINDRTELPGPA